MLPRLIVATRNRPKKVAAYLAYLARFYPGTDLVIADGSDPELQGQVEQACANAGPDVRVAFRAYPADLPLFERLLDLMLSLDDPVMVMGADDDYPLMDVFGKAAEILVRDPELAIVVPYAVVLRQASEDSLKARLTQTREVADQTAAARLNAFSRWTFHTSYGAARRETLVMRYRSLVQAYCAGFVDFQIGAEDCLSGRVGGMAELGSLRTHSYLGSYLRPEDKLIMLRRSAQVLAIADRLTERLSQVDGIAPEAAREVVDAAMLCRISELSGAGPLTRVGFTGQKMFGDGLVQAQYAQFYDLFREGTEMRQRHQEKLSYVKGLLFSGDTMDISKVQGDYETL
ncbi:MAG: TIGR00180 family glycosyltransferase [Tropicimonas sp.]|uniref:TIGR00180 family glycosyltransferase n=1 Tax=Tropicimonas sp. TaxID=2067044 RepID=UPI003A888CCB